MYFEVSKIDGVIHHVQKRAVKIGIKFDRNAMHLFGGIIESIKDNRKMNGKGPYVQGEDIDPEDQKNIRETVESFVKEEKNRLLAKANDPKHPLKDIKSTAEYFATFADFYYINAMRLLGCPNMPLFMFDNGFKKTIEDSAIAVQGGKISYASITTDTAYTRQRYANAKDIDNVFGSIFTNIDKNLHSPAEVGTLLAQYQALKIRQSNHGSIWRFFHRGENKARTEMLKKMDSHIKKALPKNLKGLDLDKASPAKVAQDISNYNIRTNVEYALTDRFANRTQEIYGCQAADEFMMAQHRFDKENQKMPLIHDTNIINDVSIENQQNIAQSEPVLGRNQDNIILLDH